MTVYVIFYGISPECYSTIVYISVETFPRHLRLCRNFHKQFFITAFKYEKAVSDREGC